MKENKNTYGIDFMCHLLEVSDSGYYDYCNREPSLRRKDEAGLATKIKEIHKSSRKVYGSPRIWDKLKKQGMRCSEKRIARIMKENKVVSIRRCKYKVTTTDSNHNFKVVDNVISRDFKANAVNRKWVGDITYIQTESATAYLASVIDLCSRRVVGWQVSDKIDSKLVCDAFSMAVFRRGIIPKEMIFHSDRGSQYAGNDFTKLLSNYSTQQSMSRKGNCWDNAVAESFFATLKLELVHHCKFQTVAEVKQVLAEWIENFYNCQRSHSSIGYLSPVEFEYSMAA